MLWEFCFWPVAGASSHHRRINRRVRIKLSRPIRKGGPGGGGEGLDLHLDLLGVPLRHLAEADGPHINNEGLLRRLPAESESDYEIKQKAY